MRPLDVLFEGPKHPYTVGLFESIPRLEQPVEWLQADSRRRAEPSQSAGGVSLPESLPARHGDLRRG